MEEKEYINIICEKLYLINTYICLNANYTYLAIEVSSSSFSMMTAASNVKFWLCLPTASCFICFDLAVGGGLQIPTILLKRQNDIVLCLNIHD